MNRRSVLTALGCSVTFLTGCSAAPANRTGTVTTGPSADDEPTGDVRACAGDTPWRPTVTVEEVTLGPGDRTVFEISVDRVTSFKFDGDLYVCGQRDVPVQFGDVGVDPGPDRQADSCPPYWIWEQCTAVEFSVPVEVSPDADPGEYEYGFSLAGGGEESTPIDRRYAIRVTDT